jgi:hypothetical protein
MPHDLIAAPFLGQHLLLRPGSAAGIQLPRGHFDQLADAAAAGTPYPSWLPGLARETWQVRLPDSGAMGERVLVREESPFGYGRASWEINLGCNYLLALLLGPEGVRRAAVAGQGAAAADDAGRGGGLAADHRW